MWPPYMERDESPHLGQAPLRISIACMAQPMRWESLHVKRRAPGSQRTTRLDQMAPTMKEYRGTAYSRLSVFGRMSDAGQPPGFPAEP